VVDLHPVRLLVLVHVSTLHRRALNALLEGLETTIPRTDLGYPTSLANLRLTNAYLG